MNKAFKFRIYPNKEQEVLIVKTFGCVRFIYNKMLGDKIEYYEKTNQKLKAVKIKQHRAIPEDYKLKSVTVSKTPTGKYFASILYEYEMDIKTVQPKTFLGLDFSMKELFAQAVKADSQCC